MNKINVAIADDNQRTVEMMTELLEQESDIEVIASADDGEEALRIIKEKQPDVVLLDIIMPKLDGIGVLERLQTTHISSQVLVDFQRIRHNSTKLILFFKIYVIFRCVNC